MLTSSMLRPNPHACLDSPAPTKPATISLVSIIRHPGDHQPGAPATISSAPIRLSPATISLASSRNRRPSAWLRVETGDHQPGVGLLSTHSRQAPRSVQRVEEDTAIFFCQLELHHAELLARRGVDCVDYHVYDHTVCTADHHHDDI